MKRRKRIYALCLALLLGAQAVKAQKATVSPLPQQIEWGEKAFDRSVPIQLVGADRMDADALQVLRESSLALCDEATVKLVVGKVGDKAVAKYKKLVPTQAEGYYLKVTPQEIVVAGRDASGTFYGVQTLLQLFSQPKVMQCEVTDWPSVSCRGVIEGFYGNPWSHEDRLRQFDFYGRHKMNVYVYGPKDDPYHRAHWRDPYPEQEAARLHELVEAAHRNKVQFVWAIHPGGDIQWNKADSMAVVAKLEKMYTLGIRTFAVFFDDIWGEGAKGDKQAGLLNYVTDQFVRKHKDVQPLIMCPTQYNKAWSGGDYLFTLGTCMYPEVRIMWTGNSVVDMIEHDDMEWINTQISRKAFIWLNYPVNDYCQSRMLMGKTYGNGLDIADMVSGFCSNPMEYAEASKVSLYSIADYTWNMPAYDAEASWRRALPALMPTSAEAFTLFCENNIDLGKTGHGLRREGESEAFGRASDKRAYLQQMFLQAEKLLADSINQPHMLAEIGPWVESMSLLARRGLSVLDMKDALQKDDSVAFIASYRCGREAELAQKAIISRNFEGSIVKARPVVSGDVVTPWVAEHTALLVKAYKKNHAYGRENFPVQVIEDGQYFIKAGGKYLTDAQAAVDRVGDYPILTADRDNINPQRQQWNVELNVSTGRYKISNVQDGRYINETGSFWKDKNLNPFEAEWHTYVIEKTADGGFTIRCGGKAGDAYLAPEGDRIVGGKKEAAVFEMVPVK